MAMGAFTQTRVGISSPEPGPPMFGVFPDIPVFMSRVYVFMSRVYVFRFPRLDCAASDCRED